MPLSKTIIELPARPMLVACDTWTSVTGVLRREHGR